MITAPPLEFQEFGVTLCLPLCVKRGPKGGALSTKKQPLKAARDARVRSRAPRPTRHPPGAPGAGGMGMDAAAMAASFREFCERPENRPLVEAQQRREIEQGMRAARKARAVEFRDTVLASDYEAQRAVAPFLEHPLLRRIVQTFTNDPRNDFAQWATNPLVLRMLEEARELGKASQRSQFSARLF